MPFAEVEHGNIHYRIDARPGAPVLVFSNSLGTDLSMWDAQVNLLSGDFTILRYDSRGHGRSLVTFGPYTIELLARDVVGLLDRLQIARVHFCGLSLGGMVGIWLAAHEPARLNKLVLANTAAQLGPPENWNARIQSTREGGMAAVADIVIERWFTTGFRERSPAEVEAVRKTLLAASPDGYMACCAAIRDMDQRAKLDAIRTPTLVISGRDDPATPPATCRALAEGIRGAPHHGAPGLALIEYRSSGSVQFFGAGFHANLRNKPPMDEQQRYERGMTVRRAVLGDAHVDSALAKRTAFNQEFQDLLTRYAWGEVWDRPGLTRNTRSLLTIAMLAALNRPDELRMHLRAASNNGVTPDEIKEVLLQVALYCGLPAANAAFHMAAEVLSQERSDHP